MLNQEVPCSSFVDKDFDHPSISDEESESIIQRVRRAIVGAHMYSRLPNAFQGFMVKKFSACLSSVHLEEDENKVFQDDTESVEEQSPT